MLIRDITPDDINFIYATWLRGLYYGSDYFGNIEKKAFFKNYENILTKILITKGTRALVACLPEEPEVILGYSVFNQDVLHYVFVKEAWRKQGIAAKLIPSHIKAVTHITDLGNSIRIKKSIPLNPFLI